MLVTLFVVVILSVLWFLSNYNFWRPVVSIDYPRVLMYHSIDTKQGDLFVSPKKFEQQVKYLAENNYKFFTVSEILKIKSSEKCVAITFDDGFADNYIHMFPIIKKYKAKATIYLSPNIQGIEKLSDQQIQEMQQSGLCEFGAHTLNHVNLSTLPKAEAAFEVTESKKEVERLTGTECRGFAYPYGRYSDETVEIVKAAGFQSAVTVKKGIDNIPDDFRIKRISILGKTNFLQFYIAITRGRYRV